MLDFDKVRLGIVGLGYVGLPLAVALARRYPTIGFDINQKRITELSGGTDHSLETSPDELAAARHLSYTSDPEKLSACNVFIVTVPTPIDVYKRPDLGALLSASATVGRALSSGGVVIFEPVHRLPGVYRRGVRPSHRKTLRSDLQS